jgi:phosphate transport system substrate-binding protein
MGVSGDKFGLGYFGLAYYEANQDKLKLLGVDAGDGNCVQPTPETVRDNTYRPLSRPLYLYVRTSSLSRPEVKSFVEFYLHTVNQVAAEAGYVPVPDDVLEKSKQIFQDAVASLPASGQSPASP